VFSFSSTDFRLTLYFFLPPPELLSILSTSCRPLFKSRFFKMVPLSLAGLTFLPFSPPFVNCLSLLFSSSCCLSFAFSNSMTSMVFDESADSRFVYGSHFWFSLILSAFEVMTHFSPFLFLRNPSGRVCLPLFSHPTHHHPFHLPLLSVAPLFLRQTRLFFFLAGDYSFCGTNHFLFYRLP